MAVLLLLWGTALTSLAQEESVYQVLPVTEPPGIRYGSAAIADFNLDGRQDLVLTGLGVLDSDIGPEPLTIYYTHEGITQVEVLNTVGEPELVDAVDYVEQSAGGRLEGLWKSAIAAADINGDGVIDIAVSGQRPDGGASLHVYLNTRMFDLRHSLEGMHSGALDWADFDHDGDPDLAACGFTASGEPRTVVFKNGQNVFLESAVLTGVGNCDLEWGDYDSDGDHDLVVAGRTADSGFDAALYINNGTGGLSRSDQSLALLGWPSLAWGDFDGDGDMDLLQTGARLTPELLEGVMRLYRNEEGVLTEESTLLIGSFENQPTPGRYHGSAAWGDYDNSGYYDLLIAGVETPTSSESTQVYDNDEGHGLVRSQPEYHDGGLRGASLWVDHDYDLDLDILMVGEAPNDGRAVTQMLQSPLLFGLRAPDAPTGLSAAVSTDMVTLSWDPAADRQTPVEGLTYNLRVGTAPEANDVVPSMSKPSGQRNISRRGNVDHNLTWTLRNLSPGTYYWSVQAVDHGLAGSEFSGIEQFVITN